MNYEIVKRKVPEVAYLNTERTPYYRSILRCFFEEYKQYRVLLNPGDILMFMQEKAGFLDYTMETLKIDLGILVEWGNLETHLDKGKVMKLEDFRQRRFKYRATEYTLGFEETTKRLEMKRTKGSLRISLVDRLLAEVKRLAEYDVDFLKKEEQLEDIVQTWDDVFDRFKRLMKEVGDYLSHINSLAFEKKITEDNETYISFKNKFILYIQRFIIEIHGYHLQISFLLEKLNGQKIGALIEIIAREKSQDINYDTSISYEDILKELFLEWNGLYQWFIETNEENNGFQFMVSQTKETIPKLVHFARYLNERERLGRNRQMEYLHLGRIFSASESIEECHSIASMVFGAKTVKQLKAPARAEEKLTETVWEHTPYKVPIMSKDRVRKERKKRTYVQRNEEARRKTTKKYEEERYLRELLLQQLLGMDVIRIRELPRVHPFIRETLLEWISSAQRNKDWIGFAQGIHEFKLIRNSDDNIDLVTTEGVLTLHDYEIWFVG